MIDFDYLQKGLYGLANAHKAGSMAGHLGAALIAGYFFGEDQADFDAAVYAGIAKELDRVLAGEEAIWWNVTKSGITPAQLFEPLPAGPCEGEALKRLGSALEKGIAKTRQSGHNAIFAALAIRALHDHPQLASEALVAGVERLLAQFDAAGPGRGYYGELRGWINGQDVELPEDDVLQSYQDLQQLTDVVISELGSSATIRRQGFGGLWHLINHGAALIELSRCGYPSLAQKGFLAHRHHLRLWRSLPDVEVELGRVKKSEFDFRTPRYWSGELQRDQARLTHRIKTLYGFFVLMRNIEDADQQKQAIERLGYLLA